MGWPPPSASYSTWTSLPQYLLGRVVQDWLSAPSPIQIVMGKGCTIQLGIHTTSSTVCGHSRGFRDVCSISDWWNSRSQISITGSFTGLLCLGCPLGEIIVFPELVLVMNLPLNYHPFVVWLFLNIQHVLSGSQELYDFKLQMSMNTKLQLMINSTNIAIINKQLSCDK